MKVKEIIDNTITMRLECDNFNDIDKEKIIDWLNWLNANNINFKEKEMKNDGLQV